MISTDASSDYTYLVKDCIESLEQLHRDRHFLNLAIEVAKLVDGARGEQIALLLETYDHNLECALNYLSYEALKLPKTLHQGSPTPRPRTYSRKTRDHDEAIQAAMDLTQKMKETYLAKQQR